MLDTFETIAPLRRRHGLPTSVLADPAFAVRLAALNLPPWEVISGPEFAACGDFPPRALPDWRYALMGVMHLPEPERKGLFPGKADYYRIDVLNDWIAGKGARPTNRSSLWVQAADYIASHGLHRPTSAREVDEQLNWLWHNNVFHLRTLPKRIPYLPYSRNGAAG